MKLRSRQNGFTLIEVMVVVVIIATISGFSVLALNQATGRRYVNQADNLLNWFQQLSDLALLEGTAYGVIQEQQQLHSLVFYRYRWHRASQPQPFQLFDEASLILPDNLSENESSVINNLPSSVMPDGVILPEIIMLPNGYIEPSGTIELFFTGQDDSYRYAWSDQDFTLALTSSP